MRSKHLYQFGSKELIQFFWRSSKDLYNKNTKKHTHWCTKLCYDMVSRSHIHRRIGTFIIQDQGDPESSVSNYYITHDITTKIQPLKHMNSGWTNHKPHNRLAEDFFPSMSQWRQKDFEPSLMHQVGANFSDVTRALGFCWLVQSE